MVRHTRSIYYSITYRCLIRAGKYIFILFWTLYVQSVLKVCSVRSLKLNITEIVFYSTCTFKFIVRKFDRFDFSQDLSFYSFEWRCKLSLLVLITRQMKKTLYVYTLICTISTRFNHNLSWLISDSFLYVVTASVYNIIEIFRFTWLSNNTTTLWLSTAFNSYFKCER